MNTSYGRFGMSLHVENYSLMNTKDIVNTNYIDSIDLGDKELISTIKINNINNSGRMMNVSTSIASAVTAYSRIEINKLKVQYQDHLLYSDTDSLFTNVPLSDNLINNRLGGLKLEYVLNDAVFLAPKVSGGIFENGKELSKIKGYSKTVKFSDLIIPIFRSLRLLTLLTSDGRVINTR